MTDRPNSDPSAEMWEVLAELVRLYDWRFELAKEEAEARALPREGTSITEVARGDDRPFGGGAEVIARIEAVEKKLRQYGREKKAAWERARAILSAQTERGWISIDDRLPAATLVLIANATEGWRCVAIHLGGGDFRDGHGATHPTHWMTLAPLPPVSQPSTTEETS